MPVRYVDAEVLEGQLDVGDVGFDLHPQEPLPHESVEEDDPLRRRQDEGAQGGDIGLQGVSGDAYQVLGEDDPDLPLCVLLLGEAAEALVVGALVGPHGVDQLVLGAPPVRPPVGQQDRRPSHAEEAVGDEHRAAVAEVPVQGDVLHADDQGVGVGTRLEKMLGEVDGDKPRAAAHPAEVVVHDVPPELVVVDDHGGERRGRIEQAAVHDQDADVLGLHTGLLEELVESAEHHHLCLLPGLRHAWIRRDVEHRLREVGGLSEARSLQDFPLELQVLLREGACLLTPLHEELVGALARVLGLVAGEVDQVDGARPGEEVQVERKTRRVKQRMTEMRLGWRAGQQWRHRRARGTGTSLGDEVMVPEFGVLEFNGLLEVGKPVGRRRRRRGFSL
ncbi:unnamed protein product [Spirodela intermedia]|uniref:Uncharacterized protein n=1 Tax=Spirodela intermedia TaxID=51605 RepID=A0A7I8JF03_SPIIN|nr:unnamed protein product [Spirodela intermedia]CAA6668730.1 unnamed protein product [Spirodela intermedia]